MATDIDAIRKQYPTISQKDAEDIKAVNESLAGLFTDGTLASRDPYILTIPQDTQFAYKHRNEFFASEWAHQMPFYRSEGEGTQYQTYRYYEPTTSTTLLQQHPSSSTTVTQSSTPQKQTPTTGPKKVMSLSAYKKQKKGTSPVQNNERNTLKPQEEAKKDADTAAILAGMEVDEDAAIGPDESRGAPQELKRSRVDESNNRERSPKRQHLSLPDERSTPTPHAAEPALGAIVDTLPRQESSRYLPAKVSPIMESNKILPDRLSPTLPRNMESALIHREASRGGKLDSIASKKHASEAPRDVPFESGRQPVKPAPITNGAHQTTPKLSSKRKADDDSSHVTPAKRAKENGDLPSSTEKSHYLPSSPPDTPSNRKPKSAKPNEALTAAHRAQLAAKSPIVGTPSTDHRPAPATKSAAQQAWEAEQKRFESIGRGFKHAATAVADTDPKLAAVRALASLMCYLLAYTCTDQTSFRAEPKQPAVAKPWRTIVPYLKFVEGHTKAFPPLTGITGMLSMALATHILSLLEATGAPSLPSGASIVELTTLMRSAANKAKANLFDIDTFAKKFPNTWNMRDPYDRGEDVLIIGELLLKSHHFPTDILTTPVQAVRAGLAILQEWMVQEKVVEKLELEELKRGQESSKA